MKKSTKILIIFSILFSVLSAFFARFVLQGILPNGKGFVFNFSALGWVGISCFGVSFVLMSILFVKFLKMQKLYGAIFFSILPLSLVYGAFIVFVTVVKDMNDITSLSIKSSLNMAGQNNLNNYLWVAVATIVYFALLFLILFVLCKPLANVLKIAQRLGDGRVRYETYRVGGGKQFREIECSLNKINYNFRAKENKIKRFDLNKETVSKNFFQFAGKNGVFELECGNKLKKNACLMFLKFSDFDKTNKLSSRTNSYITEIDLTVKKFGGFAVFLDSDKSMFAFQNITKAVECSTAIQKIISSKNRAEKFDLKAQICLDYQNVVFEIDENDKLPKIVENINDFFNSMCDVCKKFEAKIVFSKNVLKSLPQNFKFDFRYLTEIDGVSIYENLMCYKPLLKNKIKRHKNQFENAVQLFLNGEYKFAREQFSQILKVVPADKATFAYFNLSAEKIVDAV